MKAQAALGGVMLVVLLAFAAPAQAVGGLAAHWRFDEGSGTIAGDSSGNGNTGAVQGGATWVTGRRLLALDFDGSTGRVHVPSSSSLQPPAITVSAWVRRAGSPGAFKYILSKGATQCIAASYGLYTGPSGGLLFYVAGDGGLSYTRSPDAGTAVWDGNWHYVAGTFDGSSVRLYVDGAEVGSGQARTEPIDYNLLNTLDVYVGTYAGCAGLDFSGTIDEPRIWGQALSAAEVLASMRYDFHGFYPPVDNPPTVNVAKAGSAIPVKFSLGGYQGLDTFAAGSPSSQRIACDTFAGVDSLEETATPGASSLSYDPVTDRYTHVWKTDKAWAGTCRQLVVALADGSSYPAKFRFTR